MVRLGILGFGEAGHRFAKDLSEAGLKEIYAYSRSGSKAKPGDAAYAEAQAVGAQLVKTVRALCKHSDVIIALTPGKAAIAAARGVSKHLRPEQIYVDASSAAVKTMEQVAQMLEGKGRFVDAAIMSPVPLNGIKGVIGASGGAAEEFRAQLAPYGMNIKVVGEKPGGASAMKLIRSVCMKGLSAVLMECLEAAHRYGVLEAAAADIAGSFDERPFMQNMKRYVCGTAVHAERRIHEMADVLALLTSLNSSTRMTKSTKAKLMDVTKMGLREKFNAKEPDTIVAVMDAILALGPAKA